MKRPISFVLVATLLAGASAYAGNDARGVEGKIAREVVRNDKDPGNRGHERRDNDRRGDQGSNDTRRDNDRRQVQPDHSNRPNGPSLESRRDNDRRDNDRRDNDRRDNDRRDNDRRDNDRHDWNDNNRRDWNDRNHNGRNDRWDRHRNDWDHHPNYWDNRRHDRRDYARYRFSFGSYHRPHGYYYRTWHRGDRLPRAWYGNSYIVYDWHPYRLYAPPYGYHWVRVGNDVLLTALATGVVLDVIYDIWY